MGIMARFMRLCKADIHGVMDQLEDKGLLLKQSLRDMEEELGRKEARLRKLVASREQLKRDDERTTRECEKLDQDIEAAIEKDRDEIARSLIKQFKPLARHRDELGRHIQTLAREISQFRECVEEQRFQYEQLRLKSKEYFHRMEREAWEKTISIAMPSSVSGEASEAEVELEFIQRKEAAKGGGAQT
jgi:phage shock protein A